MHKFLFIDTNVFEHFPPISDIDWLTLAACTSATLVVPQVTIRELNRHKDTSQRSRQKRRAGNALKQLSQWSRSAGQVAIRPSVDLVFLPNEPHIDFRSFRLSMEVADDQLLASAIEFAKDKGLSAEEVLVVSADLGLEIKGRAQASIRMCPIDESWRLPDQLDPEEKKLKELENRVRQLTSQIPQLSLTFDTDGQSFTERTIRGSEPSLDDEEIEARLQNLRSRYPYLQCDNPGPIPGWSFYRNATQEQLEQYNNALHQFFGRHEQYLRKYMEVKNWQRLTRSLALTLNNTGSTPAEDIDITLRFPPGIEVISDKDFRALPEAPTPPEKPGKEPEPDYSVPGPAGGVSPWGSNSTIRQIVRSKTHGDEVQLHVPRLKHTITESLPLLDFHFPAAQDIKSFHFQYRIVAGNCPEPFEGVLNVKVTIA